MIWISNLASKYLGVLTSSIAVFTHISFFRTPWKQPERTDLAPREPGIRLDQLQRRVVKQRKSNHRDPSEEEVMCAVKHRANRIKREFQLKTKQPWRTAIVSEAAMLYWCWDKEIRKAIKQLSLMAVSNEQQYHFFCYELQRKIWKQGQGQKERV